MWLTLKMPLTVAPSARFKYPNLINYVLAIVKLQAKVQTSVLGLGVDFVFPLSQQEQQEQQEEPPPKSIRRGCTRSLKFDI